MSTCNPRVVGVETGESLWPLGSQPGQVQGEVLFQKRKVESGKSSTPSIFLWPLHACADVCRCSHVQGHIQHTYKHHTHTHIFPTNASNLNYTHTKQNVVYVENGILVSCKEWHCSICMKTNGIGEHNVSKRNRIQERKLLYILSNILNPRYR